MQCSSILNKYQTHSLQTIVAQFWQDLAGSRPPALYLLEKVTCAILATQFLEFKINLDSLKFIFWSLRERESTEKYKNIYMCESSRSTLEQATYYIWPRIKHFFFSHFKLLNFTSGNTMRDKLRGSGL
jgi:hypothetical protein